MRAIWAHDLKKFLQRLLSTDEVEESRAVQQVIRRGTRHSLRGRGAGVIVDNIRYPIRLKDLSCTGAAGLTDAPLQAGQLVSLELEQDVFRSAEVRWTRVAMAGVEFQDPLALDLVERVRSTIPSMQ